MRRDVQGGRPATPPGGSRRGRRWPWVLVAFVALVLLAGLVASHQSVDYYVVTPGNATPVSQYISVPSADNHPITGNILLTDVFVTQLNTLSYLQYRFLDSNDEIYSTQDLLGPSTSQSEFTDQGYLQMTQAQSFATAAALSHLGYKVSSTNVGALVYGIVAGSPAAKALQVAQVITAVDGTPTTSECGLIQVLATHAPGTTVTLSVEQSSINEFGTFVNGPVKQKTITLAPAPKTSTVTFCPGRRSPRPRSSASRPRRSRTGSSPSRSPCTPRTSAAPRPGSPWRSASSTS